MADDVDDQIQALNRQFYAADPASYLRLRLISLLVLAGRPDDVASLVRSGVSFGGITLVMVGAAALAEALMRQVSLLGWQATTSVTLEESLETIADFTAADMVVVLEHGPCIATPILAAALRRRLGYVGALGSRRTQAARRRALEAEGVTYVEFERLHGPTGLDLGARTAAETAVSIVAEILAVRSGRSAVALRDSDGRIAP